MNILLCKKFIYVLNFSFIAQRKVVKKGGRYKKPKGRKLSAILKIAIKVGWIYGSFVTNIIFIYTHTYETKDDWLKVSFYFGI